MKSSLLFILISLMALSAASQKTKPVVSDSSRVKTTIIKGNAPDKYMERIQREEEITKKLNNIVASYSNKPNALAIWKQIRSEAETLLLGYFKSGTLFGTKPQEAYFIKMGTETMTSTDIANHKMILQAGIALYKPAEFKIITIEKINTAISGTAQTVDPTSLWTSCLMPATLASFSR